MGYNPVLDTALRNRLTGAVILVLLAVLLLPELLTGSGRDPAPAPTADPDSGPPLQTYRVDLSGEATAPAGATSAAAVPVPTPGLNDVPVELPVPAAPAAVPAAAPVAEPATAPGAEPATAPATPSAVPAVPQPQADADRRKFFVQVGTFTTLERAEVLRSDLARRRFAVSINETARDDKRFYRVRVGPVADREAAAALEVSLRPLAPDRAIVAVP